MPGTRADGSSPGAAERGKARAVLNRLIARYPDAHTALDYLNAWQLLVVTVLSAQTTDENVNKVAPILFERYPGPGDLADANPDEVERIIFSTGFYTGRRPNRSSASPRTSRICTTGTSLPNSTSW
jgi:endonuclease-3